MLEADLSQVKQTKFPGLGDKAVLRNYLRNSRLDSTRFSNPKTWEELLAQRGEEILGSNSLLVTGDSLE